eukprot:g32505.t1
MGADSDEMPVLVQRATSGATVAELCVNRLRPVLALKVAIADAGGPAVADQQLIVGQQVPVSDNAFAFGPWGESLSIMKHLFMKSTISNLQCSTSSLSPLEGESTIPLDWTLPMWSHAQTMLFRRIRLHFEKATAIVEDAQDRRKYRMSESDLLSLRNVLCLWAQVRDFLSTRLPNFTSLEEALMKGNGADHELEQILQQRPAVFAVSFLPCAQQSALEDVKKHEEVVTLEAQKQRLELRDAKWKYFAAALNRDQQVLRMILSAPAKLEALKHRKQMAWRIEQAQVGERVVKSYLEKFLRCDVVEKMEHGQLKAILKSMLTMTGYSLKKSPVIVLNLTSYVEDLGVSAQPENTEPTHHTAMARHFHRLKRAEDVCVALIAFSKEDDLGGNPQVPNYQDLDDVNAQGQRVSSAVAYCESLLVLAFHLVVAQTPQTTVKEEVWKEASGNVSAVKTKMQEEAEVRAFWLLYQLSGGHGLQAFRDYYGVPRALRTATNGLEGQLTDRRGAIDDVHRLTFILARFEPEIWVQMQSLGFQLPCLFYGAFMRLFAFVLPVTSLFRFWDLLLADAQRPDLPSYKPARHALLDLAFGGVMACKETILKCQSAMEVQNCLLHFFESIYDPSYLVELVASTEYQLWDDAKSKMPDKVGLGALHTMDYENSVKNWERYFGQHRQQNKILKDITQNATGVGAANQTIASNQSANTNSMGQTGDQRVTTRTVMKVINNFLFQFSTEKMDQTNKAGIIRLMPHELLKMSPADVDTSLVGTVSSWIAVLGERFATPPPPSVLRSAGVPAPRGAMPEPHLDAATWDTQVRKAAGESWGPYAQQIFANFCLPIEPWEGKMMDKKHETDPVSLHEFFLGLICCSKGTVSEKAMALFHLFGYIGPEPMVHHINPISHSTHIIIERTPGEGLKPLAVLAGNEGKSYQEESNFLKAPRDDEIKTMALHLQIYVYAFGASGMVEVVQGEVFVPTLVPFVTNALVGDNPRTFTIWGPEKQLPPGFSRENDPALLTDHGVRPYVGDMVLDLTPSGTASVGGVG